MQNYSYNSDDEPIKDDGMPNDAKSLVKKLGERKRLSGKTNVTIRIDESLYEEAKKYLEKEDLKISEVVEEFLKDLLRK